MSRNNKKKGMETKAQPSIPNLDPLFAAPPRLWALRENVDAYANAIVFRAVDILAGYMRTVKSIWVDPTDATRVIDLRDTDPISRLFKKPNTQMSWADFRFACEAYRLIYGGWIAIKIGLDGRQTDGFPSSLLLFPLRGWDRVLPDGHLIHHDNEFYQAHSWRNTQLGLRVDDDECVFYSAFDPSMRGNRISQVGLASLPASVQQSVLRYQQALLVNDNRPGLIIRANKTIKEDNRQRLQSEMMSAYGGVLNAGRTMLLSGDLEYQATPVDPLKLTEIANKDYTRDLNRQVGVSFGIPEFLLVGVTENANRESAKQIVARFMTDTVEPSFSLFEDTWNNQFFDRYDLGVHLDLDQWTLAAFRDVAADRMDLVKSRLETGDTPEAAYRFAGIPFEANKQSQKPTLSSTIIQVQDPLPPVAPVVPTTPTTSISQQDVVALNDSPKTDEARENAEAKPAAKPTAKKQMAVKSIDIVRSALLKTKAARHTKARQLADSIWAKCVTAHEDKMVAETTKCVKRQKGEVMKKLVAFLNTGRHLKSDDRVLLDVSAFIELNTKATPKIPGKGDIDHFLPDEDRSNAAMALSWKGSFEDVRRSTESQMEDELGDLNVWHATAPEEHRDIVLDRLGDAVQINATTRKQIKASLERALEDNAGASPLQIATALRQEVKHVFDNAIVRSNTIARTELGSVMSDYRHAIMKAQGVEKVRWVSAHDSHVRPTHEAADEQGPIPMGSKFTNGLTQPHQPGAPAAEVINCRCVLVSA